MSGTGAEGLTLGRASAEPPVRAVFFGSGGFAVPILDALVAMPGVAVEAVVSAPDRPVGRKAVLTATPVTVRADELGLPVLRPERVRRSESVAQLRALAPRSCRPGRLRPAHSARPARTPHARFPESASVGTAPPPGSGADPGHDPRRGHRVGGNPGGSHRRDGRWPDRSHRATGGSPGRHGGNAGGAGC